MKILRGEPFLQKRFPSRSPPNKLLSGLIGLAVLGVLSILFGCYKYFESFGCFFNNYFGFVNLSPLMRI